MESGHDVPDGVVADDDAEAESRGHGREGRVRWTDAEHRQTSEAAGVDEGLLQLVVEVVGRWRGRFGEGLKEEKILIRFKVIFSKKTLI